MSLRPFADRHECEEADYHHTHTCLNCGAVWECDTSLCWSLVGGGMREGNGGDYDRCGLCPDTPAR